MPLGKVGVAVDSLKHTFLERRSTITPSPGVGGALVNVPDGTASRHGQLSSSLLNKLSLEYNNVEQRRARSALSQIVRKSASPAVVRLYSAAIEEPGPLKSLKPKSQGKSKKLFTARPQAHVEAFRDSRKILALAAERGKLIPAVITHRKATELVVDTRPKHVGVIPMFEKRILESGMPPPEHEEPLPYPANPYRASSPRNEPELVYGPTGVSELLTSCLPLLNRARAEGSLPAESRRGSRPFTAKSDLVGATTAAADTPLGTGLDGRPITPLDATLGLIIPSSKGIHTRDGAITPTKRSSPPGSRPNSPDRSNSPGNGIANGAAEARSPRASFHFRNVLSSAMRQHALSGSLTPAPSEAEELLKASHKSGLPPTRNTLSARKRLLQVKVHLNWKRATEDASSLVSEASISLSRQALAASTNGTKDFRNGDGAQGLGDKDLARGAFIAHRKGIVKDRFNK